ncbi:unnamed protein product [Paramecium octaurelia]|uniref:Uncharacterized protein n=1 Tax=Paramecium octaurelia TaxID=43137 RepID=A0A8S1RU25_PAROT|nr:unnamed protein product [Paramecium octaurelia]
MKVWRWIELNDNLASNMNNHTLFMMGNIKMGKKQVYGWKWIENGMKKNLRNAKKFHMINQYYAYFKWLILFQISQ